MPVFDAIVTGCGPAGNLCAERLASAGARVLLLDRSLLPRKKTCAGGISKKALELIPFSVDEAVDGRIRRVYLAWGREKTYEKPVDSMGVVVRRDRFDCLMTQKAQDAGAIVREGCRLDSFSESPRYVTVETSHGSFVGRVLVGADGAHSRVRRLIVGGKRLPAAIGISAVMERTRDDVYEGHECLLDFGAGPGGYGWVFPKEDHLNVGLYRMPGHAGRSLKRDIEAFIANRPELKGRKRMGVTAHPIPMDPEQPLMSAGGRVMLAGDAAGLGEFFFGEGISSALLSGRIASECILEFLSGKGGLDRYRQGLRPVLRQLRDSRRLAGLFYGAPEFGFKRFVRNRLTSNLFAGLLSGRISYRACMAAAAVCLPWTYVGPKLGEVEFAPAETSRPEPA